nr:hypothetical protein [Tanacetum cinerariifolium]
MIIVHEYPLLMVEHHGFQNFMKGLQTLFRFPCRNTVKSDILKIYEYEKQKTMRLFGKIKSRIAITTDIFVYVPYPHTANVLANMLYDCLGDWNLDRKVSTITVDNCTTNDAIINNLLDKLPLSSLTMNEESFHMRLNANDSQYKCLPKEWDWELAKEVCDRLQVFYEITLTFSSSKYPTANVFFALVCEIGYSLREWDGSSIEVIQKMASKMLEKFNKYWSVISRVIGMATILDPRYKMKFLELLLPKIYGQEKASNEIKTLEEFVKSLFKEYESTAPCTKAIVFEDVGSSSSSSSSPRVGFKKLFSDIATIASQHDDSSGTTELEKYYKEKTLPKDMKLDLLMWWKTNGSNYPTFQRIAKDILVIPVSTVASESAFSTSGRLISPHHSQLHPKTLKALMKVPREVE